MSEQAPGFMALLPGPEHRFDLVNSAFNEMIGIRQLAGRTAREALPEMYSQGYFKQLDQAYASGRAVTGQAIPFQVDRGLGAEGVTRYLDFVYQPLKDEDGQVFGIFAEGSDVTVNRPGFRGGRLV